MDIIEALLVVFSVPIVLSIAHDIANHLTKSRTDPPRKLGANLAAHWKRYSARIGVFAVSDYWSYYAMYHAQNWGVSVEGLMRIQLFYNDVYEWMQPILEPVKLLLGDWIVVVVVMSAVCFLITSPG